MSNKLSRRDFISRGLSIGAVGVVAGAVLSACGKKEGGGAEGCDDVSKLSASDKGVRTGSKYVAKTPHKGKQCDNCLHWTPPTDGPCGGCKVVKGPIDPVGYCNLWVKKA
jgi:hypothetical protein